VVFKEEHNAAIMWRSIVIMHQKVAIGHVCAVCSNGWLDVLSQNDFNLLSVDDLTLRNEYFKYILITCDVETFVLCWCLMLVKGLELSSLSPTINFLLGIRCEEMGSGYMPSHFCVDRCDRNNHMSCQNGLTDDYPHALQS
jgi:hypothetical protein